MTTKNELNNKFIEYCKEFNLRIEQSNFKGENYISAAPGTVFLFAPNRQSGKAIIENGENGTVHPLYGYCSADELFGYMEGMLTMLSKISTQSGQVLKVISNIDWPALRSQKLTCVKLVAESEYLSSGERKKHRRNH